MAMLWGSLACSSATGTPALSDAGGSTGSGGVGGSGNASSAGTSTGASQCVFPCTCPDGTSAMTACLSETYVAQCVCTPPAPLPPGRACVVPCGGDPTGEWTVTGSCSTPLPPFACDEPITSLTPASASGGMVFTATTMTASTVDLDKTVSHFPPECTAYASNRQDCAEEQAQLQMKFPDASCTPNDGCWCFATVPVTLSGVASYAVQGTNLAFTSGSPVPFCVQGDTLTIFTGDDGIVYRRGGKACTSAADCGTETCCSQPDTDELRCQSGACSFGAIGAPCTTDAYCAQKTCVNMHCAAPPKAVGTACVNGAECASNLCCPSATLGMSVCANSNGAAGASCPVLVADPCTPTTKCASGSCDLAPDGQAGFCTAETCTYYGEGIPTCGYSSQGVGNYCATLVGGQEQCRPTCSSDADCTRINPALHCYGFPEEIGLCDYSTSNWYDPSPERP
jgi:hypothetical protein